MHARAHTGLRAHVTFSMVNDQKSATTHTVLAHQRRVPLFRPNTNRGEMAGKPNHDTAPRARLCLPPCVATHTHTHTHTYTHTRLALITEVLKPWLSGFLLKNNTLCTLTHLHTHTRTHAHPHTHTHTITHTHTHTHAHTHTRTHTHTLIHTHTCAHTLTHTNTHIHTNIHTLTQAVTVRIFAQKRHGIACECV